MKQLIILLSLFTNLFSCDENIKTPSEDESNLEVTRSKRDYPESISNIFEAHGGLDIWNKKKTLVFTMENEEGKETTTTDLKNRMALIETDKFKMGYDGEEAWLEQDSTYFKSDPNFYYNLIFYFYAMPFVLADDGIIYSDAEPLIFDGQEYPGIKISYGSGVGTSPDDEYIIYYNRTTNQMEWLAYTVTYFSKEKSTDYHYIKYHGWQKVEGLKLPKSLQWYNVQNDSITTMRDERIFSEVRLLEERLPGQTYKMPNKQ